jgi:predicted transcriptional regulator
MRGGNLTNKVVLTTEVDAALNRALQEMARLDNCSPADLADLANRNFVKERVATRELLHHGLRLIARGDVKAVDSTDIHAWLLSDEDEFPAAH